MFGNIFIFWTFFAEVSSSNSQEKDIDSTGKHTEDFKVSCLARWEAELVFTCLGKNACVDCGLKHRCTVSSTWLSDWTASMQPALCGNQSPWPNDWTINLSQRNRFHFPESKLLHFSLIHTETPSLCPSRYFEGNPSFLLETLISGLKQPSKLPSTSSQCN